MKKILSTCFCLTFAIVAQNATATVTTWDPQGTTGANPYTGSLTGTWETTDWSTSETGQTTPGAWVENTAALFAVYSGAGTPAFTVTMNSNHTVAGIFDGPLTPDPCPVTIQGTGTMFIPGFQGFAVSSDSGDPGSVVFSVPLANGGTGNNIGQIVLEHAGQTYFNGVNTYTGGTMLGYSGLSFTGIANFNNSASFGASTSPLYALYAGGCALVAEGTSPITIPNTVINYNIGGAPVATPYPAASINIVGIPFSDGGVTFSGPWIMSGGTMAVSSSTYFTNNRVLPSYPTVAIASGGPQTVVNGNSIPNLVTISGVISGTNTFIKWHTNILALSATNTFSGTLIISNGYGNASGPSVGPLLLTNNGSISNVAYLNIYTNGLLDVSGLYATTFNLSSATTLNCYNISNSTEIPSTIVGSSTGYVNLSSGSVNFFYAGQSGAELLDISNASLTLATNFGFTFSNSTSALGSTAFIPLISVDSPGAGLAGGGGIITSNGTSTGLLTNALPVFVYPYSGIGSGLVASTIPPQQEGGGYLYMYVSSTPQNSTTLTLAAPSAITYGSAPNIVATLNVDPTSDPYGGGMVQFFINGVPMGQPVLLVSTGSGTATATFNTPTPLLAALKAAGTSYTITAEYSGSLEPQGPGSPGAPMYGSAFTSASVSQQVNPAPLTVTAKNQSTTYGTLPTLNISEVTISGLQFLDAASSVTLTAGGSGYESTNSPIGSYTLTPSAFAGVVSGGTYNSGNYTITYASPGTWTVTAKAATVTAVNETKTYGQTLTFGSAVAGTGNITESGFVNGQTVASTTVELSDPNNGGAATAPVSGNPYPLDVVSGSLAEAAGKTNFNPNNYTFTYDAGTLTINPLAVTLTGSQAYNGTTTAQAASLTVSDDLDGANLTLSGSTTFAGTGAVGGPYALTLPGSLVLGGSAAGNYTFTGGSGSITITNPYYPINISSESVDSTGTNLTVCFPTVPGVTYTILTNTTLNNSTWVNVGGSSTPPSPFTASGTSTCVTIPGVGLVNGNPTVFISIKQ